MALSTTNNYIQELVTDGNDAYSNLYEVTFSGGKLTSVDGKLKVRCGGFTPPDIKQDSYTVKFMTAYIDRPSAKVDVTHNFNLKFRIDSNWETYNALLEQFKITTNPSHSYAGTDIDTLKASMFNIDVDVLARGSDDEEDVPNTRLFEFRYCWIEKITPDTFTRDSSNALNCDCTIHFLEMHDLQSGLES